MSKKDEQGGNSWHLWVEESSSITHCRKREPQTFCRIMTELWLQKTWVTLGFSTCNHLTFGNDFTPPILIFSPATTVVKSKEGHIYNMFSQSSHCFTLTVNITPSQPTSHIMLFLNPSPSPELFKLRSFHFICGRRWAVNYIK
jgi:hypothetical protein